MKEELIFNRYAIALLSLAIDENKVDEYRSQVKMIKELLKENKDFVYVISDVNLTIEQKNHLIDKVFAGFFENIINFMKIIIQNNREFYLYEIFKETLFRFNDYLNIQEGEVYYEKHLNEDDLNKAIAMIEKKINKKLELKRIKDNSLLGGFIISVKDYIYDASLKTKIEKMKESLL